MHEVQVTNVFIQSICVAYMCSRSTLDVLFGAVLHVVADHL